MSDIAALLREIDGLEELQRLLVAIAGRSDDGRRSELIALRRRLSEQITKIGTRADALFADDPSLHRAYRDKFSAMRSTTALHQADWPAVRLGEDACGYAASAQVANAAHAAFIGWVRTTLATRRG